jgi:hypothetical protein
MTVTDPRSDPDLLQAVVSTEHAYLLSLADEARREATSTPRARVDVVHALAGALAQHVNTERRSCTPSCAPS